MFTDADVFAGTERHLIDLAQGLKSRGVDVAVACPAGSPVATMADCGRMKVIRIEKKGVIDARAVEQLRWRLRAGAISIIHAHNGRTAFIAALARSLARRGRIVATQHFLAPAHVHRAGISGMLSRTAHHWVNGRMDHLIAISQAACCGMINRGEAMSGKVSIVHNGIPIPDPAKLQSREAVRAGLGIRDVCPMIVCVARLEPEKNIGTLISAMKIVSCAIPEARCMIAGEGSMGDLLKAEIERLNLGTSVRLLGFVRDTLSLINACDLFVLPSLAEPFGLVLLEAMALGKPVIATQAGGPIEIVLDGESGLLVPPSDAYALASAIGKVAADVGVARRFGCGGLARFHEQFTVDRMVEAVLAIYSQL